MMCLVFIINHSENGADIWIIPVSFYLDIPAFREKAPAIFTHIITILNICIRDCSKDRRHIISPFII